MQQVVLVLLFAGSVVAVNRCLSDLTPQVGGACPTTPISYTKLCGQCCKTADVTLCVDKTNPSTGKSDCPARANLCTNSVYLPLMTDQCPVTCNLCCPPSTCADKLNPQTGQSDCPRMSSLGYCTNPTYVPLMRDQCPKSCGFCT